MVELQEFILRTIKCDLIKMTLKIYQPDLFNNTNKVFNKEMKYFITFNIPATTHKGVVYNQETDKKNYTIYRRDIGVAYGCYYTLSITYNLKYLTMYMNFINV